MRLAAALAALACLAGCITTSPKQMRDEGTRFDRVSSQLPGAVANCIAQNVLNSIGAGYVTQSFQKAAGAVEVVVSAPAHGVVMSVYDLIPSGSGTNIAVWLGPELRLGQEEALRTYLQGC
jgi:hypothetical protein